MHELPYKTTIDYLLDQLPEIREHYERRTPELYAQNNPHVVYGSILVEFLNELIEQTASGTQSLADRTLKQAFFMIEQLCTSSDFDTRCLAETSVIEGLLGENGEVGRFSRYMGPETRRIARTIVERWGLDMSTL